MNSINFDWENYLTQAQAQISTLEFIISLALTAITAYILKKSLCAIWTNIIK